MTVFQSSIRTGMYVNQRHAWLPHGYAILLYKYIVTSTIKDKPTLGIGNSLVQMVVSLSLLSVVADKRLYGLLHATRCWPTACV